MSGEDVPPGPPGSYKHPDPYRTFRSPLCQYDYEHAKPAATNVELLWPVVARRYSMGANCNIYPDFCDFHIAEPNSPDLFKRLKGTKPVLPNAYVKNIHRGAYVGGQSDMPKGFVLYLLIPYCVLMEAYRQGYLKLANEYLDTGDGTVRKAEQYSLASISANQRLPTFFAPTQAYNRAAQALVEYLLFHADRLDLFAQWERGEIVADLMHTNTSLAQWDCSGGDARSSVTYTARHTMWGEPHQIGLSVPGGKKYMSVLMALTSTYEGERVWR
jgi:hypothetical protein